jgi:hypothetical protein
MILQNQILHNIFLAAHFAKRNTKFGGGGKRGRAKIPSPQPLSFLPARASGFVPAARSAAISRDFVQKRFERRSVIATNQNLTIFQDEMIARSPRLRRVSLRKKPVVAGLNQTAGEARRGLFCPAGGGSELRSNSRMKFVSNFFLSAFGGIRSQFLIPRVPVRLWRTAKGD